MLEVADPSLLRPQLDNGCLAEGDVSCDLIDAEKLHKCMVSVGGNNPWGVKAHGSREGRSVPEPSPCETWPAQAGGGRPWAPGPPFASI